MESTDHSAPAKESISLVGKSMECQVPPQGVLYPKLWRVVCFTAATRLSLSFSEERLANALRTYRTCTKHDR